LDLHEELVEYMRYQEHGHDEHDDEPEFINIHTGSPMHHPSPRPGRNSYGEGKAGKVKASSKKQKAAEPGSEEAREEAPFSLLHYPFLLDASSKARLIRLAAEGSVRALCVCVSVFQKKLFV